MDLMSKNIYLVYDAKIENNTTINKLLTVLDKAGFDVLDTVVPIAAPDFAELLEKELPNFAICLNKTFKDFSITYSDKLEVPIFEFFSKEYLNKEKKICIAGLLLNIDDIFETAYKRYSWTVLTKFLENYNELSIVTEVTPPNPVEDVIVIDEEEFEPDIFCEYLDNNPREVVEETNRGAAQDILQEISQEVESEVVVEVDTKTLSTENNESDNVEVLTPILDESLKDFYLNVKQLISQFNLVQNQLKQIENKFSGT